MREIKFRAWDNLEERMYGNVQTGIYQDPDAIVEFGKILDFACYEIMQYTGLKDKNGKEIYEGDIVKTKGGLWLIEPIGSEERDGNNYGICASPHGSGDNYFVDKSILSGEVIGNIYENPELLEG